MVGPTHGTRHVGAQEESGPAVCGVLCSTAHRVSRTQENNKKFTQEDGARKLVSGKIGTRKQWHWGKWHKKIMAWEDGTRKPWHCRKSTVTKLEKEGTAFFIYSYITFSINKHNRT